MTLITCPGCNRPAYVPHTDAKKNGGEATKCFVASVEGQYVEGCAPASKEKEFWITTKSATRTE